MHADRPTGNLPLWNTDGSALPDVDQTEPNGAKKARGWEVDEEPPSGFFNWLQFKYGQWISFVSGLFGDTLDFGELTKTFNFAQNARWTGTQWDRVESGKDAFLLSFGNQDSSPGYQQTGFQFLVSPASTGDTNLTWQYEWEWDAGAIKGGRGPISMPLYLDYASWALTAQNSWAAQSGATPFVYKDPFGIVHLGGAVVGGTNGLTCGSLHTRYRPNTNRVFICTATGGGGGVASVQVTTSGTVIPTYIGGASGPIFLDGINFGY